MPKYININKSRHCLEIIFRYLLSHISDILRYQILNRRIYNRILPEILEDYAVKRRENGSGQTHLYQYNEADIQILKISDMTIKDYGNAVLSDGSCANPAAKWVRHVPYNKHEFSVSDHTDEQTVFLGSQRLLVLATDGQTL